MIPEAFLYELKQAKGLGLTRHIGISNFTTEQTAKAINIIAIAEKHQATAAQVVLAWMRQKDIATIPSSTKEKNLKSNPTVVNHFNAGRFTPNSLLSLCTGTVRNPLAWKAIYWPIHLHVLWIPYNPCMG